MLQTTHKGLSGTALKTIALVLMLMDHIHYFFEFTGCIPEWFSMLSAVFASLTSILAKVGMQDVDSNLGTAIRTAVFVLHGGRLCPYA